jgi:hypothetical protein
MGARFAPFDAVPWKAVSASSSGSTAPMRGRALTRPAAGAGMAFGNGPLREPLMRASSITTGAGLTAECDRGRLRVKETRTIPRLSPVTRRRRVAPEDGFPTKRRARVRRADRRDGLAAAPGSLSDGRTDRAGGVGGFPVGFPRPGPRPGRPAPECVSRRHRPGRRPRPRAGRLGPSRRVRTGATAKGPPWGSRVTPSTCGGHRSGARPAVRARPEGVAGSRGGAAPVAGTSSPSRGTADSPIELAHRGPTRPRLGRGSRAGPGPPLTRGLDRWTSSLRTYVRVRRTDRRGAERHHPRETSRWPAREGLPDPGP